MQFISSRSETTKGPTFGLNETQVERSIEEGGYGIGRRGFRDGVALLRRVGVLRRTQKGRRYARDQLVDGGASYVQIDEQLIRNPSKVVAFILAINLSPIPIRPADVAGRFGITSPEPIRRLTREAIALGAVAHQVCPRGEIKVARMGYNFDLAKNVPTEKVSARNVTAHSNQKDDPQKQELQSTKFWRKESSHGTRSSERVRDEGFLKEDQTREIAPKWRVLKHWTSSAYFLERGEEHGFAYLNQPVTADMSHAEWTRWLKYYGGAPEHLSAPASHRQALEIAHELSACEECAVTPYWAMVGLAFASCKAHASGKQINSLALIAEPLMRDAERGDDTWVYDLPHQIDDKRFSDASKLAQDAVAALESHDLPLNRRTLLSTYAVEQLDDMITRHTRSRVVAGINYATKMD